MKPRLIFTLLFLGAAAACLRSIEPGVSVNLSPEDDTEYAAVYEKYSKKFELIKDFETHYIVGATSLSAEFLGAFSQRYQRIFNEPQPILEEAATKAGFFVSLFSANRDMRDLADDAIWNIQLERDQKIFKPLMIKHLPQKERWRPFFRNVNLWTREFLVVFDAPQTDLGTKELVKATTSRLLIANSEAKLSVDW